MHSVSVVMTVMQKRAHSERPPFALVHFFVTDGSTFLQLKRAGAWTPGALGKNSKHTDLDTLHLQSDTKNHKNLFSRFLRKL